MSRVHARRETPKRTTKIIPLGGALLGSNPVDVKSSILLALGLVAFSTSAEAAPSTTSVEQGYELGEIQHPRSVGMAGAQTALGSSTTAIFVNPANLPLQRVYHFEALAAFSPESRRQSYGGAVADSSTSRLAGGFGGTWSQMDPDGIKRQWTDLRLTLAYPLSDRISFGLTGRYLRGSQNVARGPLGASLASDGTSDGPLVNTFTFDAGVTVIPVEGLRLGVVGKNLTVPGNGMAPTVLAAGIGYQTPIFAIEADGLADFTTWNGTRARAMIGGEVFLADHVPIRVGYRYDDGMRTHAVSAGLGYVDKRWSVELGARRDVAADYPATLFVLGLRLFYDGFTGSDTPDPM